MALKFEGKLAVVTGGSTGMGLATAKRFVDEGMEHVFITGRRREQLDDAVRHVLRLKYLAGMFSHPDQGSDARVACWPCSRQTSTSISGQAKPVIAPSAPRRSSCG